MITVISKIIGDGSDDDAYRPAVSDYANEWNVDSSYESETHMRVFVHDDVSAEIESDPDTVVE